MIKSLWKVLISIPVSLFMDWKWGKIFWNRPFNFSPTSYWFWELGRNYRKYISHPLFKLIHRKHIWSKWVCDPSIGNKYSRICKKFGCYEYQIK